ncbi:hypothetical protein AB1Y20_003784 [Prymnesium parvum]|uniref:GPI inositol-deacylase n=1 Tax=Prymnesium parvum TaxID=97485 RepID=A0AB34J8Q0_PRYPA
MFHTALLCMAAVTATAATKTPLPAAPRSAPVSPVLGASTFVAEDCLFLHGLGVEGNATDAFFLGVAYWLDLKNKAKQLCKRTHFPIFDTVTRGAGSKSLQDDFFNLASKYQGPNDRVFAHSMGNVILARACVDQSKCLERGWFQAHGPLTGTVMANLLLEWCPPNGKGWPEKLGGFVADLIGYCTTATYSLQTCDMPGNEVVCGTSDLISVGRMTRHGVMCGTSGWGVLSIVSPLLATLDEAFFAPRHASPDDGMVSLSSCTAGFDAWTKSTGTNVSFGNDPAGRFYVAETNHADGMGFDNGLTQTKKPVLWFENMIKQGWQA